MGPAASSTTPEITPSSGPAAVANARWLSAEATTGIHIMPAQSRQRNTVSLFIVITDFEKKLCCKGTPYKGKHGSLPYKKGLRAENVSHQTLFCRFSDRLG
jgi:hypothetical protein